VAIESACTTADLTIYAIIVEEYCTSASGTWVVLANRGQQPIPEGSRLTVNARVSYTQSLDQPIASGGLSEPIAFSALPPEATIEVKVPEGVVDCNPTNDTAKVTLEWVECQ
jgi:hypothetical protein